MLARLEISRDEHSSISFGLVEVCIDFYIGAQFAPGRLRRRGVFVVGTSSPISIGNGS